MSKTMIEWRRKGAAGMQTSAQHPAITVIQELELGTHHLLIHSDRSIEILSLCDDPLAPVATGITLDGEEAYHLFISLKEVFK